MLTEEQKQELREMVSSMKAQGVSDQEIQALVDARRSEMLASSTNNIETQPAPPNVNEFGVSLDKLKVNDEEFEDVIESFKIYDKSPKGYSPSYAGAPSPAPIPESRMEAYKAWKDGKELKEIRDLLPNAEQAAGVNVDPRTGQRIKAFEGTLGVIDNFANSWDRQKLTLNETLKRSAYELVGPEWADVIANVLESKEVLEERGESRFDSLKKIGSRALSAIRNDYSFIDPETNKKIKREENEDRWQELNKAYEDIEFYKDRKGKLTSQTYTEEQSELLKNGPQYEDVKKVYNLSNKEVGEDSRKGGKEYIQALEAIDKVRNYTGPGIEEALKNRSFTQLLPALASAFETVSTSVLPTIAATTATAFVTKNPAIASRVGQAMITSQIGPQLWTSYNEEKAQELYPSLSKEEAFDKATKEGKLEFAVPAALTLPSVVLEKAGIKGITKVINSGSYGAKGFVVAQWGALTETGTELAQLPIELLNTGLGKGLKDEELAEYVWEGVKEQGVETALQTYAGTLLFGAAGKGIKTGYKAMRDQVTPEHIRNTAANSIFTIGVLKQNEALETNDKVKEGIRKAIRLERAKLRALVKEGNDLGSRLTPEQLKKAATAEETIQSSEKSIKELNKDFKAGKINKEGYLQSKAGFQGTLNNSRQVINRIVEKVRVEKQPVIRNKNGTLTTKYENALQSIRKFTETRSSNEIALDEYKLKNNLLKEQKANNEISTEQFDIEVKKNIEKYKKARDTSKQSTEKVVKGVKESSVQSSKELQKAFDESLESGDITIEIDEKGKKRNVFNNKALNRILKTQGGFLKSLSNKVFGAIPENLRIGTKPEYESNLNAELLKLLRTYDPSKKVPLGAYIQVELPKRAISKSAFENISSQTFTKDIESQEVQGMIVEEESDIDAVVKNINTAQELGIGDKLMNTISNVAKQALITAKEKVDNLKFKTDIAKTFQDALYSDLKTQLGLKNTKTNKGLTNAIEANPDAFYDAMSVESMRKARAKGGVNPFEQAGFLKKDTNGILQKVALDKLTVKKFLGYITDPKIAKNTRSDRQMRLVEALAVSMGAREAINLLENDTEFRQRFAEQQQQEQQTEDFKEAADKIQTKSFFTKLIEKISILRDANSVAKFLNISESGTVTDKNRTKVIDNLIKLAENGYLSPNAILAWNLASVGRRYKSLDKNGTREYYLNDGTTSKPISKKIELNLKKKMKT